MTFRSPFTVTLSKPCSSRSLAVSLFLSLIHIFTTLDDKIIPYITNICKRDPRTGKVVTGGIVSCKDSSWLLSWTINRQGQFKTQDKDCLLYTSRCV